jgi:hypothetical protein
MQSVAGPADVTADTRNDGVRPAQLREKLKKIWARILKTDQIGIHDNFYAMAGTLLA